MKNKIRIILIFIFLVGMVLTSNAFGTEGVSVLKVETIVMEKGSEYYSVTVKAFVKNDGESGDVTVKVVATDYGGTDLKTIILNGFIKQGQTRLLFTGIKIPKKEYEAINHWVWDGGWSKHN